MFDLSADGDGGAALSFVYAARLTTFSAISTMRVPIVEAKAQ